MATYDAETLEVKAYGEDIAQITANAYTKAFQNGGRIIAEHDFQRGPDTEKILVAEYLEDGELSRYPAGPALDPR